MERQQTILRAAVGHFALLGWFLLTGCQRDQVTVQINARPPEGTEIIVRLISPDDYQVIALAQEELQSSESALGLALVEANDEDAKLRFIHVEWDKLVHIESIIEFQLSELGGIAGELNTASGVPIANRKSIPPGKYVWRRITAVPQAEHGAP
jgi:hypothetical protein